jgi:carotenoid cleavage dioxygenase
MKHPVTGKEIVAERWQGDIDRAQAAKAGKVGA